MTKQLDLIELANKPILITGASAGIGLACAKYLLQAGAQQLILTGRDADKLEAAKAQLLAFAKCQIDVQVCDQSRRADLDRLFSHFDAVGWPSALIANVGVNPVHQYGPKKIHNIGYEQIEQLLTTNITHTFYLLTAVLKAMRVQRFGRIVLIGSQGWEQGIAGQALYNLSKSSLTGLKNSIVSEYATTNVFCHLLSPGLVLNERTRALRRHNPQLENQFGVTEMDVAAAAADLLAVNDIKMNGQELKV